MAALLPGARFRIMQYNVLAKRYARNMEPGFCTTACGRKATRTARGHPPRARGAAAGRQPRVRGLAQIRGGHPSRRKKSRPCSDETNATFRSAARAAAPRGY